MARPRTVNAKIKDLPRGMRKVGAYWYWRPTDVATREIGKKLKDRKVSVRAGKTPIEARKWWELHVSPALIAMEPSEAVSGTVEELLRRYEAEFLPDFKRKETRDEYTGRIKRLRVKFGTIAYPRTEQEAMQPGVLRDVTVQQHLKDNAERGSSANKDVQLLSRVFRLARTHWGLTVYNPCGEVIYLTEHARDVYVDDKTYTTIHDAGNAKFQCMAEISSQTGARIGSIYTIRLSQITKAALIIRVGKKKNGKGYIEKPYTFTPDLRAVIDRALELRNDAPGTDEKKNPAGALFLTQDGNAFTKEAYKSAWRRIREKLGLKAREITVHDLGRAKAVSDASSDLAGQELAGHEDARITRRVYRRKQAAVSPLPSAIGGRA